MGKARCVRKRAESLEQATACQVKLSATRERPPVLARFSHNNTRDMQLFSSIFFTACTLMNSTGVFSSCELKCCEGNLCDPYGAAPTTAGPTSTVSVLVASFGTILVAFVLSMLA